MNKENWIVSDISNAMYLGCIEIPKGGEFYILKTNSRLIFGGNCNTGFIESGFMEIEDGETIDYALQELLEELELFYTQGPEYTNRIVTNERM